MSQLFNETFGAGDGKRLDVIPWLRFGQNKESRRLETALNIRDRLWDNLAKHYGTVCIYMYIYATDLNSEFEVVKIDLFIFLLTVFGKKRYWSHAKSDERKLRHRR